MREIERKWDGERKSNTDLELEHNSIKWIRIFYNSVFLIPCNVSLNFWGEREGERGWEREKKIDFISLKFLVYINDAIESNPFIHTLDINLYFKKYLFHVAIAAISLPYT